MLIQCLKQSLAIAPRYDQALRNLGVVYQKQGKFLEFRETLGKFDYRNDAQMVHLLSSDLVKLNKYDDAAAVLREGLHQSPRSPELLELLGYLEYARLNDPTNAYEHFTQLLHLVPDHPKRGEYTNAVNFLARRLGKTSSGN